jgi:AcrR family transcriptional regulator
MDRRPHYLDTALRLFSEHGYNGVSMDQLVSEAGGSKATLYRYFSSKQQLFEAIIDDLSAASTSRDDVRDLSSLELTDGLRRLGTAIAAAALSEQAIVLLRLALGEVTRFPELGRTLFERGPAISYGRFRVFVAAKHAAGDVHVPDLDIAAEQFIGGIVGHQQLRKALGISQPSAADITARIDAAVAAFVATYASSESAPASS